MPKYKSYQWTHFSPLLNTVLPAPLPPSVSVSPSVNHNEKLNVMIFLKKKKQISSSYMQMLQTGKFKFLTHKEVAKTYGAGKSDLALIKEFAAKYKLKISKIYPLTAAVLLSGNAGNFKKAFAVKLSTYSLHKRHFIVRTGPI